MIIDCISDLHGFYPELEGGDLLIVAGDLTAKDTKADWMQYFLWQGSQDYKKIIFIAGNHDNRLQCDDMIFYSPEHKIDYLCDSGTEFEGLKIWGSPWTKSFEGMNPKCKAFTVDTDEELAEKWKLIPEDVDILVTHCPPYGFRDEIANPNCSLGSLVLNSPYKHVGSQSLTNRIKEIDDNGNGKNRILICGHVHEGYGILNISNMLHDKCTWKIINASHVNERYQPVNRPIRIEL